MTDRLWGDELPLPLGLGTNTFGRTTDADASHAVLDRFEAAGGSLVDTADTYSGGAAETILGDWMRRRGSRDRMVVVTKVGNHPRFDGLSAPVVTAAVEESLRRLGTDHVDLCLAHYQDDKTPSRRARRRSTRWSGPGRSAPSGCRTSTSTWSPSGSGPPTGTGSRHR